MNNRQRRLYWRIQQNKTNRQVARFRAKFFNALQADVRSFENAIQEGGFQGGQRFINNLILSPKINKVLNEVYSTIGVQNARITYNGLRTEKAFTDWLGKILDYLGQNFYDKGVFQIVKTSRQIFIDALALGTEQGWGYRDMSAYLRDVVTGINRRRAETIARTEIGRAIHSGQFVGADSSPFESVKEWISAKDNRTRGNPFNGQRDKADHWDMDGQLVDVNKKFIDPRNGVELNHPHDPEAGAADVINCRCTYAVVAKRDENGRMIRKRTAVDRIF
jgi:hypothetical protein